MRHDITKRLNKIQFDSFQEFINWCRDNEGKTICSYKDSENDDFYFTHSRSYKDAIKIAEDGWNEGAEKINKGIDKIHAIGKGYTIVPKYEVAGESVEIGRYLTGDPECMQEWEIVETVGHKVVDIYFNVVSSGGYSTDSLINYGTAVLSIIDYLESIGIRVNLYSYFSVENNSSGENFIVIVKVKAANEALNLPTCAFAVAHPSMQRRFMFKVEEIIPGFHSYGYGKVQEHETKLWAAEGSIIFQSINNTGMSWNNPGDVDKFLATKLPSVLNSLGVDMETNYDYLK